MALKLYAPLLDYGLDTLNSDCDKIVICSQEPTSYTDANVTSKLGEKVFSAGAAFGNPADYADGRKITAVAINDGDCTGTGTPTCWAALDTASSSLLASGPATGFVAVTPSMTFSLGAFTIDLPRGPSQWWLAGSAIDLDLVNGRTWDGNAEDDDFTVYLSCSRASSGYAKKADGTLQSFNNNELRITSLGLLVEDARTNLSVYSQDFSQVANWQVNNVTVSGTFAAPDGTTTANQLTISTSTATPYIFQEFTNVQIGDNVTATFSVYVKLASGTDYWIRLNANQVGTAGKFWMWFNINTLAIGNTGNSGVGVYASSSVESLGNGWVRISLTGSWTSGSNAKRFEIDFGAVDDSSGGNSPSAGALGDAIYAWGAQVEVGSFPSSYIPTTTTSAARASDLVTWIGALDTAASGSARTFLVDVKRESSVYDSNHQWIHGVGNYDYVGEGYAGAGETQVSCNNPTIALYANIGNSLTSWIGLKCGYADDGSGRSLVAGGGTVATDASTGQSWTTASLGTSLPAKQCFTYFRRLTVWSSRLADATLQGLTAP